MAEPYFTRLASIGCPIVPVPMNPIFMPVSFGSDGAYTARHVGGLA